jgi:hypothetical protein
MRRNRKVRIAIVLAIAVFVGFYAWRTNQSPSQQPCEPGRWEEKDANGAVIKISRKHCD